MKQFEYMNGYYINEEEMNQLGLKGCEAYAVWDGTRTFLKREL